MKSHIGKQSLRKLLYSYYVRILPFSSRAPVGSQISLCIIHDNSVSKLSLEGKGGTLCDEVTHQKAISQILLSSYSVRIFPFSPQPSMSSQIYLCRIHDNSVSKLFQEGKGETLCDEVTYQKAISQKASLQLLCEDTSFFTLGPYRVQISRCRIHENSVSKLFQEGKGETLCDEFTHQKVISQKVSFQLLCEDISFSTMGLNWLPNITLQISRKQ